MEFIKKQTKPSNFLFKRTLTLSNIIRFWEEKAIEEGFAGKEFAHKIFEGLKETPEFLKPIESLDVLKKDTPLLDMIMSAVFPFALQDDELACAMAPYDLNPFYATKKFSKLFDFSTLHSQFMVSEDNVDIETNKNIKAYTEILSQLYGVEVSMDHPILVKHIDQDTQLQKYYRLSLNKKLYGIKVNGKLPVLTEEMIQDLRNNLSDLSLWTKYLPPHHFEFHGLAVLQMVDVTEQEILSSLKYDLLEKDSIRNPEHFYSLQKSLRDFFGVNDLKLGLGAFQKNSNNYVNYGRKICQSITLRNPKEIDCSCSTAKLFNDFQRNKKPLIFHDISSDTSFEGYGKVICEETGIRNLILAPLYNDEEFIGILELGSPNPGQLNSLTLSKLNKITSLFAIAVKRNSEELENQIRTVIRTKYTTIHPAVEWKFVNSALKYIERNKIGTRDNEIDPIIFDGVYPLYGASDIRSSSFERNVATRKDLTDQLNLIRKTLSIAFSQTNLPLIEQIIYRIDKYKKSLSKELISGDEALITDAIKDEIEPLLVTLAENNTTITAAFEDYKQKLDPELGIIYEKRKAFEESLNSINTLIASYLEDEQKVLQNMYPHYFEKYKTDGIEYNIYIGDSITETRSFDMIFVRNLRLWQLTSMAEIAFKTYALAPHLKVPLETTQLILVHSSPLSIRFRMDEKRFDVDGGYNVRYEIMKKRIDKALIKDTKERLTQPGTIVIVYSQQKEAIEYKDYIKYLQNKKLLLPKIEDLELEDIQDVQGLKALRVSVNLENHENALVQNLINETLSMHH